jgi:hypothetical protein
MHPSYRQRPEPIGKGGYVLIGTTQLVLLHGLYDRQNGFARSSADWARAALPYSEIFRVWRTVSVLRSAMPGVHPAWVSHGREGRRNRWTLTARGRAILELQAASWIRGVGPYEGLQALWRRAGILHPTAPRGAIAAVLNGPFSEPIRRILAVWSSLNRPRSFNEQLIRQGQLDRLREFVCEFVLEHNELPRGFHAIDDAAYSDGPFVVDFDELRADEWRG